MARQSAVAKENAGMKARAEAKDNQPGIARRNSSNPPPSTGPEKTADLDRLIHERVRLAIVSALAVNQLLTFNELKELLKTSDGNLSVHARKLEEAGYVTCNKYFDGRMPKTEYRLTVAGRRALEHYLDHMEAVIRATRGK
ncbi:MAG: transcriptional regulator [Pyrinomonadaceae bacterium]